MSRTGVEARALFATAMLGSTVLAGCAGIDPTDLGGSLGSSLSVAGETLRDGVSGSGSSAMPEEGTLLSRLPADYEPPAGNLRVGPAADLAQRRAEGFGLVHGPELKAYLDELVAKLIGASGMRGVPAEAYVRASMDVDAFATPDGLVYVAVGLLRNLTDEGQLAYLMAHELSHVLLRHHNADTGAKLQHQVFGATVLVERSRTMVEQRGSVSGWEDRDVVGDMEKGLQITEDYVVPLWSREQETEADLLALDLLVKAGYPAEASLGYFDRVMQIQAEMKAAANPEPPAVSLAETDWSSGEARREFADALFGIVRESASDTARERHKSWDARKRDLETYLVREYADAPPPRPSPKRWREVQQDPAVGGLLANYRDSLAALALLGRESLTAADLAEADQLSEQGASGITSEHALPRLARSDLHLRQRQVQEAIEDLEMALEGPEPVAEVYRQLSELLLRAGEYGRVVELADRATAQFDNSPRLYPMRIFAYRLAGRHLDLMAVQQRCASEVEVRESCDERLALAARIVETHGVASPRSAP